MATGDGWHYIAQRYDGTNEYYGAFLDLDVPLQGVNIDDVLSGHNGLSATITPEYPRLKGADGKPILLEGGTALWAESPDGEIRGGGIVTRSSFGDGGQWQIECTDLTGIAIDLPYNGEGAYFVNADPADLFRYVWKWIQSQRGSVMGIDVDYTTTPIRIGTDLVQREEFDTEADPTEVAPQPVTYQDEPFKLNWYENLNLDDDLANLAERAPFDWHLTHRWEGDLIRHKLRIGYPRLGRRRHELRFVVGENIHTIPEVTRDWSDYANEVIVLGAGEGSTMVRAVATRSLTGRIRKAVVVSDPSLKTWAEANRRAEAEIQRRSQVETVTEIELQNHPHAPIGSVNLGDEILVEGDIGWVDFSVWCRVIGRTMSPDDGDKQILTVVRTNQLT